MKTIQVPKECRTKRIRKTPKLHPCPFCNEKIRLKHNFAHTIFWVECLRCEAKGPRIRLKNFSSSNIPAIRAWNKRINQNSSILKFFKFLERFLKMKKNDSYARFPDSDGYWWMNDPHAYGWETVRVRLRLNGETVIFRTGCYNAEEIPTWCCEWLKIEPPNK